MAIAYVQSTGTDAGSVSSASRAFAGNNTAGNLLIISARVGPGIECMYIEDTNGNKYQRAHRSIISGDANIVVFYAVNCAAGANTVSIYLSNTATLRWSIAEYSGLNGALVHTSDATGTGTAVNSGSITTTKADALLIGVSNAYTDTTFTKEASWSLRERFGADKYVLCDKIVSSTGTYDFSGTLAGSMAWSAGIMAFIMPPTILYDNTSRQYSASAVNSLTTPSWTIAGTNRLLMAALLGSGSTPLDPDQVKWGGSGGTALTMIGTGRQVYSYWKLSMWDLVAPATGSNTLYCHFAANMDEAGIIGVSYQGVDQSSPHRGNTRDSAGDDTGTYYTNEGQAATPSITLTGNGTVGDTLFAVCLPAQTVGSAAMTLRARYGTLRNVIDGTEMGFEYMAVSEFQCLSTSRQFAWYLYRAAGAGTCYYGALGITMKPVAATTVGKVNAVTYATMAKINGVAKASLAKINGVT